MEAPLTHLFGLLVALGYVVGGFAMYYQNALYRIWRSERAAGRGRWGPWLRYPWLIFSTRIPVPARPQRYRYVWSIVAFFIVSILTVITHWIAYPNLHSH